jgi:nitrogen regulatory protein PII
MKFQHEAIFCIVNSGYSDVVMEAAKKLGASGGTVINARGTAPKDAESIFGITIEPEKEIVMILVPSSIKANVLHALYQEAGLDTPGQGIAFALPVDGVVGLSAPDKQEKADKKSKE